VSMARVCLAIGIPRIAVRTNSRICYDGMDSRGTRGAWVGLCIRDREVQGI
jgi:hypothetical protein